MKFRTIGQISVLSLVCSALAVQAGEAENLLKKMQTAVHDLNYQGRLVYSRGDELAEFQIQHQTDDGAETVVRLGKAATDTNSQGTSFSLVNSNSLKLPAKQAYSIDLGGDERVAGIDCKVIVVRPKDKLRYLHRYCINPQHGMLLKYSVMNRQQKLLEQFMFTQLQVEQPAPVTPANTQAQLQVGNDTAVMLTDSQVNNDAGDVKLGESSGGALLDNWHFRQLPAGFQVSGVESIPGKPQAKQVIFSDGLTYISVFIEPLSDSSQSLNQQLPASGATNILSSQIADFTVTLVGEVPQETLRSIHSGLSYVTP